MMSRKKIVIIDDEEDLCHLMKRYFLELDHEVFLANTLGSGLSLIREVSPDVVFIDNNLPDGLGWEKMSYLLKEYPECKINLISAYDYLLYGALEGEVEPGIGGEQWSHDRLNKNAAGGGGIGWTRLIIPGPGAVKSTGAGSA